MIVSSADTSWVRQKGGQVADLRGVIEAFYPPTAFWRAHPPLPIVPVAWEPVGETIEWLA